MYCTTCQDYGHTAKRCTKPFAMQEVWYCRAWCGTGAPPQSRLAVTATQNTIQDQRSVSKYKQEVLIMECQDRYKVGRSRAMQILSPNVSSSQQTQIPNCPTHFILEFTGLENTNSINPFKIKKVSFYTTGCSAHLHS